MKELIRKILRESEFDWTDNVGVTPTYEGHPQGVVYLRSHGEITEFLKLLEEYNGGWIGPHGGYKDFHQAWDSLLDRVEGNDWDGYTDWVPTMSASFFVEKKYPNKLTSGYWDHDVDNGDVEDWLGDDGVFFDEVFDKEHWKIYDDVSQLRTLLGERLVESNDMDWAVEIKPEIDFKNLEDQPFIIQWKDGREVDKGWRIGKVVEKNGKEYILIKGNKNEPWTRWKLILAFQGKMKKYKFKFKDEEIQSNWTITESLDWVSEVGYDREQLLDDLVGRIKLMGWDVDLERGSEQTSHVGEWFFGQFWCGDELYELYESMVGSEEYEYSMNYHTRDERSGELMFSDSYDNMTPKELMSKITKVIVKCLDGDSVNESNDFEWSKDIEPFSQHKDMFGRNINPGDVVKVVDTDSEHVGQYLDVDELIPGEGYEKHGGAFTTYDHGGQYFAGNEVELVNESNDFEWTESAPALGRYNADDLYELVMDKRLRIGYTVRLIGYGGDIDRTFNHTGTVIDVYEKHIKYQGQGDEDDEFEYGFKVMLNDFNGYDTYEYEVNNTFGDQDLTFDIISNGMNESEFDWTDEADVTWSTYYDEIFRDVLRLPQSIEDVDMDTLLSTYYKLDVLTREVQKGSKLKNTSTFGEIHDNITRIINNVNKGKDQELYVRMKNYMLGDIQEVTRHLKLVGE